jgi:hypothetical protein
MELDDKDFDLVRKNLNILSVLILILAYANAQLHSLNFLGIQIDFDGDKLYQALFIGYSYFVWRFLTKLRLLSGFWNDFLQYYMTSEFGVKSKYNYTTLKKEFDEKSPQLKQANEQKDDSLRLVQLSVIRFPDWPLTKLRLSATFYSQGAQQNFNVDYDIKVSKIFLLRKLLTFCVKLDKFGDYLFPLIPVLTNIFFFTFKTQWQGSFSHLFLK